MTVYFLPPITVESHLIRLPVSRSSLAALAQIAATPLNHREAGWQELCLQDLMLEIWTKHADRESLLLPATWQEKKEWQKALQVPVDALKELLSPILTQYVKELRTRKNNNSKADSESSVHIPTSFLQACLNNVDELIQYNTDSDDDPSQVIAFQEPTAEEHLVDQIFCKRLSDYETLGLKLPAFLKILTALHTAVPAQACDTEEDLSAAKLAAMKELAYGASHDINNPLANIASRSQTLLIQETDPEKQRLLSTITAQAQRASEMISDMMLYANPPEPAFQQVLLLPLIDTVIQELAPLTTEKEAVITCTALEDPKLEITADPDQLSATIRALIQNSLEAMQQPGNIHVTVTVTTAEKILIKISDDGMGIDPDVLPHIFDPFYSGREAGKGSGFGLCKAWRIAQLHQGEISITNNETAGVTALLTLPVEQAPLPV